MSETNDLFGGSTVGAAQVKKVNEEPESAPIVASMTEAAAEAYKTYNLTTKAGQEKIQKHYEKAYADYATGLQDVQKDLTDRSIEAYRTYVEAMQKVFEQGNAYEQCLESYHVYVEVLSEAWQTGELQKQTQDAYTKFISELTELQNQADAKEGINTSIETYTSTLKDIWQQTDLQDRAEKAHANYMKLLKELNTSAQHDSQQATENLVKNLNELWTVSDSNTRSDALLASYSDAMQDTWAETVKLFNKASVDAVNVIQKSWKK